MSVFVLGPDWSCGLISTCCVVSHTSSVSCSACQGWTRSLRSLSLAEPFRATAFSIQWRFYQNIRVNVQKCLQGVRTNKHAFWGSDLENLIHAMKFSIIKPLPAKCVFMFSPNVYQLFAYLELADCWNIRTLASALRSYFWLHCIFLSVVSFDVEQHHKIILFSSFICL